MEEEYEHIVYINGKYYRFKSIYPDLDVALEQARAKGQNQWEVVEPRRRKTGIVMIALGAGALIAVPIILATLFSGEAVELGVILKLGIGGFICLVTGLRFAKFSRVKLG